MGKVTAIVSAYFAKEYLIGRLTNLRNMLTRVEIVVVAEVGSPEAEIARHYDVHLIETVGIPSIYGAWNLAIKRSTGDYITNANCDDRHYIGSLEVLASALDENPDHALCYAFDDIVAEIDGDPVNRHEWVAGGFKELLDMCFVGPMPMWRRSLHDKYGYFDEDMKSAGDYEFWLRIASRGEQFLRLPRSVGAYLLRMDSAERREPLRTLWETARARSNYRVNI